MKRALLQAWENTVRRRAEARAVAEAGTGREICFRELAEAGRRWRHQHVPDPSSLAGRAVIFGAPNGIGWWEIFLGLLEANAVLVPLDPGEPVAAQRALAGALRAAAWWDGHALRVLPNGRRYRDAGLIKLTSGSTGQPRPLVFTDVQMLADGQQVTTTMGITARDLNYALIPFGHSYGLGNLTIPLLARGVPLVCGTSLFPGAIGADFARWRPSVFPGVPAMWRALAGSEEKSLAGLRLGISAGAPLPADVAREFAEQFGCRLHGFYGSSETGGIAYDRSGAATLAGGVGTALRGVRLQLQRGERLRVSSAAVVTHGNRRRVGAHGAWIMPDRARLDARGNVTLSGRRGTTVKVAGRRINLVDVTERLRRVPGVDDVWVGLTTYREPALVAVVATARTPASIRAELAPTTAGWLIPKRMLAVPALPLTARGKTDTRALRQMVDGSW